jgi:hypothetical protein
VSGQEVVAFVLDRWRERAGIDEFRGELHDLWIS